jgi:hypothetical protein
MGHLHRVMPVVSVGLGLLLSTANTASSGPFVQTDLVSDISGLAKIFDASLVNPWGSSHPVGGPFWISASTRRPAAISRSRPVGRAQ